MLQDRRVKHSELRPFILNGTLMYLQASGTIKIAVYVEGDDRARVLEWSHAEQNLTLDGQSICTDPESSSGAIWSRFLHHYLRIAKNGNQNVCELFLSLGLDENGLCAGSSGAKPMYSTARSIPNSS